ncbi:hypothetical protein AX14_000283 [Amanita brunnescens Koide BX004]|nr:hypothetical protein AX14_000283 [Amanita brunnescens Koide BX004]
MSWRAMALKGDEYIGVVLQDRLNSYDSALEPNILGINSVENGIFLNKNLHAAVALGFGAFPKTPNFALDPADILRVEPDPMPPSRITWYHLQPNTSHVPMPRSHRRGQDIKEVMQHRFAEHYESIPRPPASLHSSDCDKTTKREDHSPKMSDGMLHAMDNVLALSMLLKGITPELMARERQ